ncbi:hypothetical protein T265_12383 [Opisthorchis viverrini]|uniref:PDZ domain-containing protein n=1 Tax=Opisthorchis viverrini TaxID=6198 RepID=A0A074YY09_OPIVI|nr:hypothetical protein T265_12383 [Opisthorchis viverrini]KER18072.1 hypothetical protein T265_12383 [Opisthorchis viverrini]
MRRVPGFLRFLSLWSLPSVSPLKGRDFDSESHQALQTGDFLLAVNDDLSDTAAVEPERFKVELIFDLNQTP